MKHKLKIYLDTSVISALFDKRNPERRSLTKSFFKDIESYSVMEYVLWIKKKWKKFRKK